MDCAKLHILGWEESEHDGETKCETVLNEEGVKCAYVCVCEGGREEGRVGGGRVLGGEGERIGREGECGRGWKGVGGRVEGMVGYGGAWLGERTEMGMRGLDGGV